MKRFAVFIMALALLFLSGCGSGVELSPEASAIQGSWAYIHSKDFESLLLKDNGKAVFENEKYTYDCDGTYLTLTASDGTELKMRYVLEDGTLNLYKSSTYTYSSVVKPDGVVGVWEDPDDHWSYEFTENGTFREDKYFTGYYTVNYADGTIKLVYNDQFEDTTIYYSIDGYELTVEYPWPMVPTEK